MLLPWSRKKVELCLYVWSIKFMITKQHSYQRKQWLPLQTYIYMRKRLESQQLFARWRIAYKWRTWTEDVPSILHNKCKHLPHPSQPTTLHFSHYTIAKVLHTLIDANTIMFDHFYHYRHYCLLISLAVYKYQLFKDILMCKSSEHFSWHK